MDKDCLGKGSDGYLPRSLEGVGVLEMRANTLAILDATWLNLLDFSHHGRESVFLSELKISVC